MRPITDGDIRAATRGLRLDRRDAAQLYELIVHHAPSENFASQVIVAAAAQLMVDNKRGTN